MKEKSAASAAIKRGLPIFHASKLRAVMEGEYYQSQRDKRHADGSVYVYPVIVETKSSKPDRYLVSLVTYKKQLCSEHDQLAVDIMKMLMYDICRRFELELSLMTAKTF
jgi:hypothetical protein